MQGMGTEGGEGRTRPKATGRRTPEARVCLLVEVEIDFDDGCDFYGVSVDDVGTVAPFAYGVHGGSAEEMMSADDVEIFDGSGAGDDGLEEDGAFRVGETGESGVFGGRGKDEVAGHDSRGDFDGMLGAAGGGGGSGCVG